MAIIGIDFDGTCVTHEFPKVGMEIGAAPCLKALVRSGHKLILHTMRSDIENPQPDDYGIGKTSGKYLSDALEWFKGHGIELYGVNENPGQHTWTHSPKPYCHLYIDDAALGCPLIKNKDASDRPYVDWLAVWDYLIDNGYILI
jgi:hypothetical protein